LDPKRRNMGQTGGGGTKAEIQVVEVVTKTGVDMSGIQRNMVLEGRKVRLSQLSRHNGR
jgi:hypothetical protein